MKKNWIYYTLIIAVGFTACKPEFEEVERSGGSANFSKYVAIGNSLTAGYADGALYTDGQKNSFPLILSKQMAQAGGASSFSQPLMPDNNGGIVAGPLVLEKSKLILRSAKNCLNQEAVGPGRVDGVPQTDVKDNIFAASGPFNNMGIPGAKVIDIEKSGFGDITQLASRHANPYYVRMASGQNATVLQDVLNQKPTFFTCWIGNNDVLSNATAGGVLPITPQNTFADAYNSLTDKLVASGAKGAVANIPDVTSIPFFTTVPWNVIALRQIDADNLTVLFKKIGDYVDATYGVGKGEQYRLKYQEGGNPAIIATAKTTDNPLGWRQIKEGELILLSIPQDSIRCAGYGVFDKRGYDPFNETPAQVAARVKPIQSVHVLTSSEILDIQAATNGFNQTIKSAADKHNLAHIDMNARMKELKNKGVTFNAVTYTPSFVTGGSFSLDGVHLTPRGYALIANYFIDGINAKYSANLSKVDVNSYPGLPLN